MQFVKGGLMVNFGLAWNLC